jgi:hypothetical protein
MLNKTLYDSLKSRFGRVKILNLNVRHHIVPTFKDGERHMQIKGGEYYMVCCPHCGDRRFRLEISYLYGTTGPDGSTLDHLFHCFNEDCEKNGFDLRDALQLYMRDLREAKPDLFQAKDQQVLISPGECVDLRELPSWHPSHVYLRKRGYDVNWLCQRFGLVFCTKPYSHLPSRIQAMVYHRIIFPVIFNRQIVGWQARYVDQFGDGTPPSNR